MQLNLCSLIVTYRAQTVLVKALLGYWTLTKKFLGSVTLISSYVESSYVGVTHA